MHIKLLRPSAITRLTAHSTYIDTSCLIWSREISFMTPNYPYCDQVSFNNFQYNIMNAYTVVYHHHSCEQQMYMYSTVEVYWTQQCRTDYRPDLHIEIHILLCSTESLNTEQVNGDLQCFTVAYILLIFYLPVVNTALNCKVFQLISYTASVLRGLLSCDITAVFDLLRDTSDFPNALQQKSYCV